MSTALELAALYRRDLIRLQREIEAFAGGAKLWNTLPGMVNSAGNLTLHLEGNLREYIGKQLGGIGYTRDRPAEFSLRDIPYGELLRRAAELVQIVPAVIEQLGEPALNSVYPEDVLGQELSVRQFLIHLYGHVNYHLGQIDYLRRALTGDPALPPAGL